MRYKSFASWEKISDSSDTHSSKESAQAVCDMLVNEYSHKPCSIRGRLIKAWIAPHEENNLTEKE